MKTTVTIEDDVSAQLASAAQATGVEVNKLVNELVRRGLSNLPRSAPQTSLPFRQRTHDFGPPLHPSLDKIHHLADALDDEEHLRKSGLFR